jgi:flavodoxin
MVKNKRSFFAAILAFVMILALTACGSSGNTTESDGTKDQTVSAQSETENNSEITPESKKAASELQDGSKESESSDINTEDTNRILVVYFSWSGHLDSMAHWVADETGGDLYRVTAADPYPEDYNATADRAKQEQDDDVRPEISVDITPEQMSEYDTIFFGFPVWWYDLPMPMWTFLENYDFSGKTIIPFFSHEGSSNGANALPTVEKLAVGATVRSDDALSIRGGNVDSAENDVRAWVQGLNY